MDKPTRKPIDPSEYCDEHIFKIGCKGRDKDGNKPLSEPVSVEVKVYQMFGTDLLSSGVKCQYNTGSHGQRCRASHPEGVDKVGTGVNCPYSFDIPYAPRRK